MPETVLSAVLHTLTHLSLIITLGDKYLLLYPFYGQRHRGKDKQKFAQGFNPGASVPQSVLLSTILHCVHRTVQLLP